MQTQITTGKNRTGMKASPIDSGELLESLEMQQEVPAPELGADAIRAGYLSEADAVGSMPPPATIKGVFGAAMQALSGNRLSVLLDKLGERAAYERSGTRLYEAALLKLAQVDQAELPRGMSLSALQEIHDDEASHFELLSEAIEQLGGDATSQTPCADVVAVQSMGLLQVMADPRTTPAQALQTLLAAELVDVASWELLIDLSDGFGLDELTARFRTALASENRHLERVRGWLEAMLAQSAETAATRQ
ncbi:ferritin-like domain-containing protein [Vulcaniibacterium tengchongense]|uniref:Ferritin-like protein n=1 Tax=Vulcaniibacterium tengchongense TaxID=1273429 RepID=A0A3N4V1R4_9GAMM|nr:ferritin-like domain-containing protein [Vulcaniibacterium tengchongense]RPE76912.1 hypothetical protein EDC50_2164 [Vulcaniibacterium tengchongense]